jgi:hypothetical protein
MVEHGWWRANATERFWLESTDRTDVGVDLRAPERDESGKANWRYTLFKDAQVGDLVFHYHKPHEAIIGASRISGPWFARPIVWAARGTFARAKGVKPHQRPGYVVPLSDYTPLPIPLRLDTLRGDKERIERITASLQAEHPRKALYFPFELGSRPIRPLQGYAFKLPRAFVMSYPQLAQAVEPEQAAAAEGDAQVCQQEAQTGGQGYNVPPEVRRAVELRAMQQAAAFFRQRGYEVTDVSAVKPYDLLAVRGAESLTVEVKGTTSGPDAIFLTRNEVDHARARPAQAVLFILHSIRVQRTPEAVHAGGGLPSVHWPWAIDAGSLEPLQFRYIPPPAGRLEDSEPATA